MSLTTKQRQDNLSPIERMIAVAQWHQDVQDGFERRLRELRCIHGGDGV